MTNQQLRASVLAAAGLLRYRLGTMSKIYRCTLDVRGYELDSFGHVNHANYINYLEHARWKMLEEEQITLASFEEWKRWPVIAQIQAHYLKPTFLGDHLEVRTTITEHGKTNFTFGQTILRKGVPVFEAQVRSVIVNEKGRPASLPPEISRLWSDRDAGGGI